MSRRTQILRPWKLLLGAGAQTTLPAGIMTPRRLLWFAALLCLASPIAAHAQRGGMPDFSGAPPEIQAIWKKIQSGGTPTRAEAEKMGQYLAAHSADIEKRARQQVESTRVAAPRQARLALGESADPSQACPTRSPALRTVAAAPVSATAARAFLDSISRTYLSRETPAAASWLRTNLAAITDAARLDVVGAMFTAGAYDGAAVAVFAEAARRGGDGEQRRWTNLGAALVSAGDPTHALTALRRSLALGSAYPLLVHQLGVAYADLGDLARADSLLRSATAAMPTLGVAWDALARVQSCNGNMTAAWVSLAKAQALDWSDQRERELTKHDPESNDDKVEAAKPFPEPSGATFFRPPPAPPPADLAASTPVLADTWRENVGHAPQFIAAANAYGAMASAILAQEQRDLAQAGSAEDAVARQAASVGQGDVLMLVGLSNSSEAKTKAEQTQDRYAARVAMTLEGYRDHDSVIVHEYIAGEGRRQQSYDECQRAATNDEQRYACRIPYCRARVAALDDYYSKRRDNARTFFGGIVGIGATFDAKMRQWFVRAGDPSTRIGIDADRRFQLAAATKTMFSVAAGVGPSDVPVDVCFDPQEIAALRAFAAKEIAKGDPGHCDSFDKSAPFLWKISGDCNSVKFSSKFLVLPVSVKFEYHRADRSHAGTIFIGAGKSFVDGAVTAQGGLQLSFDQGGWVKSFGPAASASAGNGLLATASVNGSVNLLDHGPAGQAGIGMKGFGSELSLATDTGFTGHLDN